MEKMYCSSSCRSSSWAARASSHAYCARRRENSERLQSIMNVVRSGDAGSSAGNAVNGSTPVLTSPMLAVLGAVHVLALQLQLVVRRVPVRRPLHRGIHDPGARRAAEGVGHGIAKLIGVLIGAISRLQIQPRHPHAPAGGITDVP